MKTTIFDNRARDCDIINLVSILKVFPCLACMILRQFLRQIYFAFNFLFIHIELYKQMHVSVYIIHRKFMFLIRFTDNPPVFRHNVTNFAFHIAKIVIYKAAINQQFFLTYIMANWIFYIFI